jgi:WASH complex subunit FAM21
MFSFQEDSKNSVKPWERPWNTDEMRQQSANWNLAGDAGLLKHLQQFSQVRNILIKYIKEWMFLLSFTT